MCERGKLSAFSGGVRPKGSIWGSGREQLVPGVMDEDRRLRVKGGIHREGVGKQLACLDKAHIRSQILFVIEVKSLSGAK